MYIPVYAYWKWEKMEANENISFDFSGEDLSTTICVSMCMCIHLHIRRVKTRIFCVQSNKYGERNIYGDTEYISYIRLLAV